MEVLSFVSGDFFPFETIDGLVMPSTVGLAGVSSLSLIDPSSDDSVLLSFFSSVALSSLVSLSGVFKGESVLSSADLASPLCLAAIVSSLGVLLQEKSHHHLI